jgi:alkylation response protein AidB-like acyl-CoA dehydrogenase
MDLTWSDSEQALRAEARAWLEEHIQRWRDEVGDDIQSGDTREGFAQHLIWERMLFSGGWAVVTWPKAYGGRDATLWESLIFEEEYYRVGGPMRVTQNGVYLLAPSVFEFGTQRQKDYILPRIAACEDLWCQGWSEPNAGSDLASLRTSATRVDGGWLLNGQKIWTTRGAYCTHIFGLFRTDPDSKRHRGITYLLVPLDLGGITVRGFGRLDGDHGFAEVFFADAFLPDELAHGSPVLGGENNGWHVAMATLASERGLSTRPPGRFTAEMDRLIELYRAKGSPPRLRDKLIELWTKVEAYQVQTLQVVTNAVAGRPAGSETSFVKLWWSEFDVQIHELALDLLGPEAEIDDAWSRGWMFSLAGPIYAGTNEVQRNITAERVLGLPRR